jgi:hypothetical protein
MSSASNGQPSSKSSAPSIASNSGDAEGPAKIKKKKGFLKRLV